MSATDVQAAVEALSADALAFINSFRQIKLRSSIVVNEAVAGGEAFRQAEVAIKELVDAGHLTRGEQVPTDDRRLVCKRRYHWTETGLALRDAILSQPAKGAA